MHWVFTPFLMILINTLPLLFRNVLSSFISLSEMPKFIQVLKKKSLDGVDPALHLAMVMKCSLWILYGLPVVHKDSILVTTTNGVGFIIEASYLVVFWIYCVDEERMCFLLAFYSIVIGGLSARHTVVGVVCNVFNIYLYVELAAEIMRKTKSFKHILFWLSFVSFINAGIWIAYSLIYKFDIYGLISSGVGTLLCSLQLIVHAYSLVFGSLV
ncbi:Bidirectional sugar transporter SWEET8 [Cardamine amara subsp. amara]|uniref:Bidirectional sugar transporter SWEET8 n=1 Tax=Cardamine amara subsp. amara TaxID=228776 RepID=A0ABD1BG17_CARAN